MRAVEFITESKTVEFEGLTLKISKNGHQLMVNALDDWGNKVLGHVTFNIGDGKELDPQDLKVDDKYQGQGIARVMYDYVKSLGYTIVRSYDQTDAGKGFWDKHRGEDVRVWEESNSTNVISAEKLWDYVSKIHPEEQQGGGFLKTLIMLNPEYELKRVPLTSLHIPNDEDEGDDPYGRAMFVDVDHAEEYSQYEVDKKPLVVDSQGYILDGAHRAWAASELLNKKDIMAYVPVKTRTSTPKNLEIRKQFTKPNVAEGENNDTAISLSKLGKFHPGADTLAEFVPERATAQYALHPDKWESTFYSLTNKDSEKLKYYGPKKISIPPGTLVGDMAIANKFYRAKTPEEQEQYAELYKQSLKPYPVDVSQYRMPELLIPKQGVAEGQDDNGISFQIQKGKNKFATTLSIGNNSVGVYQYDANTGRSIAEVYPEFKGKGLGKLLVLHAIYTAAKLGLDFQEDESRTSEYDNVLDSLSGSGYIVDDEGYWYVTGEGEQFLKQSLKQGVAEGSLNESAVFLNPTTVVVGQAHGQPLELSPNTLKQIQAIAAKHGAYYEGNGTDRAHTKGQIDRYIGSWDDEVAKTASPNDPKWLYVLFANVDENNRVQRVGVDPKDTIFNRLLAGAQDNSFQGIGYTAQALQKFLQMASEGKYDFVKMSQQPATQENLTRFLKAGEALMWPGNWEQYPNRAGKIAKAATVDVRDQYLATRKAGVYVTGSGHLKAVQNITGQQGVAEGSSNNIPTTGINVRSDGNIDYASLIVDGEKKYESRKTDSLRPYVGKTVGIVRTGNGPAVAIGQVTIGEPIVVDAEKFNRLRKQHLVPQASKFDIDSDGTKYLYPMIDPVRWDNEKLIKHKGIVSRKIEEDKSKDPIVNAVIDFYKHVGKIHKDPIDDYVSTAKEMLGHVSDPTLKSKLLDIFRQAKQNPYVQGGVVTTIGALLAGGVLSSAQKMGLSPSQTNLALQAILNTVIPTVVSRINGKSWSDTIKYTLASAGIGTGIAGMMEEDIDEGAVDWAKRGIAGAAIAAGSMGANAKAPNMVQQIVEPGDTVYSIARQNNVNPLEIYKLNKMGRNTKLEIGQKVIVPDYSKPISKMPATVKPTIKQEPAKVAQPAPSFKDKISSFMPKMPTDDEGVTLLSDNPDAEAALQTAAKAAGLKGSELAQFMAQTRHESWDFSKMKEVGNKKTFAQYEKPKMAKRLGNKVKGDGELFKGRGFIQLTGRDNYTRASQQIFGDDRLVKNPELASRLDVGAKIALWFWKNQVRPNVSNFNNTIEVVKAINSGEPKEVVKQRHTKFKEYMAVL